MNVRITAGALGDLAAAEEYWSRRDPHLYVALVQALEETLAFLITSPNVGSATDVPGVRKWRIGRTPFLLFYRHESATLTVARIRHERENWRNPH
jgi:toxin ParE1/3/4